MDKLKYIKLENEDGSYSDSIPLAVDSDHVDVGGNTLTNELNNKANSSYVNTNINSLSNEINTQKTRIDNLAHLEEGSTTGDAELIDGRTGFDGYPHSDIGDNIRKTTQKISDKIFKEFDWKDFGWWYGAINSNGTISDSSSAIFSYIMVSEGDRFYLDDSVNYVAYYRLVYSDDTLSTRYSLTNDGLIIPENVHGVMFCVRKYLNTAITPEEIYTIGSHIKVPYYYGNNLIKINDEKSETSLEIFNKWINKTEDVISSPLKMMIGRGHQAGGYYHGASSARDTVCSDFYSIDDHSTFTFDNTLYKGTVIGLNSELGLVAYGSWDTSGELNPYVYILSHQWKNIAYWCVEARPINDSNFTYEQITSGNIMQKVLKSNAPFVDKDYVTSSVTYDSSLLQSGYYINGVQASAGKDWTTLLIANANSVYYSTAKKLNNKVGFVRISVDTPGSISSRAFGFCDANNIITEYFIEKEIDWTYNKMTSKYECLLPITNTHFFLSLASTDGEITVEEVYDLKTTVDNLSETSQQSNPNFGKALYIAPNGNDDNDGTITNPLATIDKALEKGANKILIKAGTYTLSSAINLNKAKANNKEISLINIEPYNKVIFRAEKRKVATAESLVDGYTKVYTTDELYFTTSVSSNNNWLYQKNVNEASTLISDEERHPCERGVEYRCNSTKIIRADATVLADALTEIESSTTYKWFFDTANQKFYFSRPHEITSEYPIEISIGQSLFNNANRLFTLNCTAIETDGLVFNIDNTRNSRIIDCTAKDVFGGGSFTYSGAIGAEFIRCEAYHTQNGSNGDGFNGHSVNEGEIYSKQTVVELRDCWSHDNKDDGYSDHERSEIVIRGGLYEYNGKGGVTPSYGSHCSCFNVYSRNNYNGFYYTGARAQAEGGMWGQMICYNCVAENNKAGGSSKAGFKVDGTNNNMILIGCKSINNRAGYNISAQSGTATLIDCGSLNDTMVIEGSRNQFIIKNTELVTLE